MAEHPVHPRDASLSPRTRAKREQIRQAAQKLFLRDGFKTTSTDAIASEARVSKQTIYAHFPSKEALLADVVQNLVLPSEGAPHPARRPPLKSHADLRRAVRGLAKMIVERLMQPEYLSLLRVIAAATPSFPELSAMFREAVPERVLGLVSSFLSEAQAKGLVEVPDTRAAARLLVGPLLTFAIMNGLLVPDDQRQPPTTSELNGIVELFLRAVSPR
jgi:TetR/AcrR family transcriptional regulator, mexJK operon transcriptional repressor